MRRFPWLRGNGSLGKRKDEEVEEVVEGCVENEEDEEAG
jgi:hypothetical protein